MKIKVIKLIIIIFVLILLVPIPIHIKDGGTVEYKAITYSIKKYKTIGSNNKIKIDILGKTVYSKPKKLTLDNVIELSKKGDDLTSNDFEDYLYYDIGSGLIIEKFEINDDYYLELDATSSKPMYIRLVYSPNSSSYLSKENIKGEIDIRKENVEEFIKNNK